MKYYHGSSDGSLKELTTSHYGGKLYVTDSYPMAIMYAGCSLRNWNYDKDRDLLILYEVCENAFEKMYKDKKCYIYNCDINDAIKDERNISNHAFVVNHNVVLNEESFDYKWCDLDEFINLIEWYGDKQELKEKLTAKRKQRLSMQLSVD